MSRQVAVAFKCDCTDGEHLRWIRIETAERLDADLLVPLHKAQPCFEPWTFTTSCPHSGAWKEATVRVPRLDGQSADARLADPGGDPPPDGAETLIEWPPPELLSNPTGPTGPTLVREGVPIDRPEFPDSVRNARVVEDRNAVVQQIARYLAKNFHFPRKGTWVEALEDRFNVPAEPIDAVVDLGSAYHRLVLVAADPFERTVWYSDDLGDQTPLRGPADNPPTDARPVPIDQGPGLWQLGIRELAARLVFADLPVANDQPPSADIYDESVRAEAGAFGAPPDVGWNGIWHAGGVTYLFIREDVPAVRTERVPYRQVLGRGDLASLVRQLGGLERAGAVLVVDLGGGNGHAVTLESVNGDTVLFHDPWPRGSLLQEGANALGIAAKPAGKSWSISMDEAARCVVATSAPPDALARLAGLPFLRRLDAVLAELAFFHVSEVGRRGVAEGLREVEVTTAHFRDQLLIRFLVDDREEVQAAILGLRHDWVNGSEGPLARDLAKSFLAAAVSPRDWPELGPLVDGLFSVGPEALIEALGNGRPHLLSQARSIVLAFVGAAPVGLATFPFSRVVARSDSVEPGWVYLATETASRAAGVMFSGHELPEPWSSLAGPSGP